MICCNGKSHLVHNQLSTPWFWRLHNLNISWDFFGVASFLGVFTVRGMQLWVSTEERRQKSVWYWGCIIQGDVLKESVNVISSVCSDKILCVTQVRFYFGWNLVSIMQLCSPVKKEAVSICLIWPHVDLLINNKRVKMANSFYTNSH